MKKLRAFSLIELLLYFSVIGGVLLFIIGYVKPSMDKHAAIVELNYIVYSDDCDYKNSKYWESVDKSTKKAKLKQRYKALKSKIEEYLKKNDEPEITTIYCE